jgi:hypothetical protein
MIRPTMSLQELSPYFTRLTVPRSFVWWKTPPGVRSFNATEYEGAEESLALLEEYWAKNGPFDGILGFSQVSRSSLILVLQIPKPAEKRRCFAPHLSLNTQTKASPHFSDAIFATAGGHAYGNHMREGRR